MKSVIVYYSLSGNVACAARELAARLGADLLPIQPQKAYPDKGVKKFFWGGKSAVMGEQPPLQPYVFSAERYDAVILAFPVWAGTVAPPVRTFAVREKEALRGKTLGFAACQSGAGAPKAFRVLEELVGEAPRATLTLIDPKDKPNPQNAAHMDDFCRLLSAE